MRRKPVKNTVMHFAPPSRGLRAAACGHRSTSAHRTMYAAQVTCGKCKRSPSYKAAVKKANAFASEARKAAYPRMLVKGDGDCTTFPMNPPGSVEAITTERGKNYGKPAEHFNTSQAMYDEWFDRAQTSGTFSCMDIEKQRAVCHGVRFIIDKITRAAENPMLKDNWNDIEGYAWCVKNALGMEPDRE